MKNRKIIGVFDFVLKLTKDDGEGPAPPELLEFTNGQFESRIKKEWID